MAGGDVLVVRASVEHDVSLGGNDAGCGVVGRFVAMQGIVAKPHDHMPGSGPGVLIPGLMIGADQDFIAPQRDVDCGPGIGVLRFAAGLQLLIEDFLGVARVLLLELGAESSPAACGIICAPLADEPLRN